MSYVRFMIPTYTTKSQREWRYLSQSNARTFSPSFLIKKKAGGMVQAPDTISSEQCNSECFPASLCSYPSARGSGSPQGVTFPFSISSSCPNYFLFPFLLPTFFLGGGLMLSKHTLNSKLYKVAMMIKQLAAFAREQICVWRVLMIILEPCPRVIQIQKWVFNSDSGLMLKSFRVKPAVTALCI